MKQIVTPLILVLALAACETMEGAGEDVSNAGDALSDQAQETQEEL